MRLAFWTLCQPLIPEMAWATGMAAGIRAWQTGKVSVSRLTGWEVKTKQGRKQLQGDKRLEWLLLAQMRTSVISRTQPYGFDGLPW